MGRTDVVARLTELLEPGRGAVVFISGEAGSGKTTLATKCLEKVDRSLLRSRGRERTAQPLSLLRGALPDIEFSQDPAESAAAAEEALPFSRTLAGLGS